MKSISPIFVKDPTVSIKFDIEVDGYAYDVNGLINIRNNEFNPELIGVFGVDQFAREVAKTTTTNFVAQLRKIVAKEFPAK